MSASGEQLSALRRSLASIEEAGFRAPRKRNGFLSLDKGTLDCALKGGIERAALHEVIAERGADAPTARGFAAALALRASSLAKGPIVWARQDHVADEIGDLSGEGLNALGLDPRAVLFIKARDASATLIASIEAAQCAPVGAVVTEIWGASKALDLNATRRLMLASQRSGVTVLLIRMAVAVMPSAAETRWSVRAVPARALAPNAPGLPAFSLALLRHRHGIPGGPWRVEWNADDRLFHDQDAALPRDRVSASFNRPVAPHDRGRVLRVAG